jgi:hypothetical protein
VPRRLLQNGAIKLEPRCPVSCPPKKSTKHKSLRDRKQSCQIIRREVHAGRLCRLDGSDLERQWAMVLSLFGGMRESELAQVQCSDTRSRPDERWRASVKIEDGGRGLFLSIQAGAAFQGRNEDRPRWINGLVWAELDLSNHTVALQPNHWSASHREWKVSSESFPNSRRREGEDWWDFPLPGFAQTQLKEEVTRFAPPISIIASRVGSPAPKIGT